MPLTYKRPLLINAHKTMYSGIFSHIYLMYKNKSIVYTKGFKLALPKYLNRILFIFQHLTHQTKHIYKKGYQKYHLNIYW